MINKAEVMATYGLSNEEFDTLLFDFQEMDVDGCAFTSSRITTPFL